jgi:hypothetical protein
MAYHLHHTIEFINPLNESLRIELYKKDVVPDDVTSLLGNSFSVQYPTGEGDKFDTIISCEAKLNFTLYPDNPEEFDDFIVNYADEWKLIAYSDSQIVFVGFITPGEGRAEFQDKPYDISLTAVDGLGLLKGTPLMKLNGDRFTGVNLIIDYIIAILNRTNLVLNVRVFSNIVEESMEDRTVNPNADTFNQTGLHCRTFLKNATEFSDCYKCLEIILSEYFNIYQHNGIWTIVRIGELQESIGAKMWYTEYDANGVIEDAQQFLYEPAAVGRDRLIHPVEISQFIGSNFAIKSSRYTFNYRSWPELPTNNKFERGTLFDTDDFAGPPPYTEKKYTIEDWQYGVTIIGSPSTNPPNGMQATSDLAYRLSTFNIYNVETLREVVLERSGGVGGHRFLVAEGIPVKFGDRAALSIDFKLNAGSPGNVAFYMFITIEPSSSGAPWRLAQEGHQLGNYPSDGVGSLYWQNTNSLIFLGKDYVSQSPQEYSSMQLDIPSFPVDGNLYICFMLFNPNIGVKAYYKGFNLDYYPTTAGSAAKVKGDYAETSQNDRFKDAIDEEVFISDSEKKVLQGTLYRENLTDLTTPTWHRYGVVEGKHFKELGELARFNANYRRMWKIDGQFDGLKFTPANNPTIIEPLSFHRQYTFPDSTKLNGHYFVLVPPLTINYSEGRADMNFIEVLQDGVGDGDSLGDNHIPVQYIFE